MSIFFILTKFFFLDCWSSSVLHTHNDFSIRQNACEYFTGRNLDAQFSSSVAPSFSADFGRGSRSGRVTRFTNKKHPGSSSQSVLSVRVARKEENSEHGAWHEFPLSHPTFGIFRQPTTKPAWLGDPGATRTHNQLLKRQLLCHWATGPFLLAAVMIP